MTGDEQLTNQIAADEQWLASILPVADSTSNEHLKLRIRVALDEQWLGTQSPPAAAEKAPEALHQAVRRALTIEAAKAVTVSPRRSSLRALVCAGLGLAAMVFLAWGLSPPFRDPAAMSDDQDDFEFSPIEQEIDQQIEEALQQLQDVMALGDEPLWDDEDL